MFYSVVFVSFLVTESHLHIDVRPSFFHAHSISKKPKWSPFMLMSFDKLLFHFIFRQHNKCWLLPVMFLCYMLYRINLSEFVFDHRQWTSISMYLIANTTLLITVPLDASPMSMSSRWSWKRLFKYSSYSLNFLWMSKISFPNASLTKLEVFVVSVHVTSLIFCALLFLDIVMYFSLASAILRLISWFTCLKTSLYPLMFVGTVPNYFFKKVIITFHVIK